MNSDDFEKKLERQPMRAVPAEWRAEILRKAVAAVSDRRSLALYKRRSETAATAWWRDWLWPRPLAWGSLAAVWVVIAALYLATPATPALTAKQQTPLSREMMQCLAEQRREMAALLDPAGERSVSQQPKQPGPRTELTREITAT